ncbi:MAG: hypothetical protein CMN44_04955 [SAR116 cluster bacterium]|nr:hypothetical protein [SAR116 cluster bacterium]RPH10365.1 MAG: hypothetical protein CBC14_004850 [Alphaproteobacteria bacterium TMED54]|tara:strand:- start:56 stop:898 length:843 start_codon:yes stop_codon:yes gene_type:complete
MNLNALQFGFNLDHIALESPNPKILANFYKKFLMMEFQEQRDKELICEGKDRKIIFKKGVKNKLAYAGFTCRNKENLVKFKKLIISNNVEILDFNNIHFENESFTIIDPDKNKISFGLRKKTNFSFKNKFCMPLQHLTLSTKNIKKFEHFYNNILGFKITDRVIHQNGSLATCFLTSNHEHHTIACFKSHQIGVDHHSYEVGTWDNIKILCDFFSENNIKIMWGPGRHGPGNNLFIFVEDPDKNWIEFSAELELIDDRNYKEWPQCEKTLNLWGKGILRS